MARQSVRRLKAVANMVHSAATLALPRSRESSPRLLLFDDAEHRFHQVLSPLIFLLGFLSGHPDPGDYAALPRVALSRVRGHGVDLWYTPRRPDIDGTRPLSHDTGASVHHELSSLC